MLSIPTEKKSMVQANLPQERMAEPTTTEQKTSEVAADAFQATSSQSPLVNSLNTIRNVGLPLAGAMVIGAGIGAAWTFLPGISGGLLGAMTGIKLMRIYQIRSPHPVARFT